MNQLYLDAYKILNQLRSLYPRRREMGYNLARLLSNHNLRFTEAINYLMLDKRFINCNLHDTPLETRSYALEDDATAELQYIGSAEDLLCRDVVFALAEKLEKGEKTVRINNLGLPITGDPVLLQIVLDDLEVRGLISTHRSNRDGPNAIDVVTVKPDIIRERDQWKRGLEPARPASPPPVSINNSTVQISTGSGNFQVAGFGNQVRGSATIGRTEADAALQFLGTLVTQIQGASEIGEDSRKAAANRARDLEHELRSDKPNRRSALEKWMALMATLQGFAATPTLVKMAEAIGQWFK